MPCYPERKASGGVCLELGQNDENSIPAAHLGDLGDQRHSGFLVERGSWLRSRRSGQGIVKLCLLEATPRLGWCGRKAPQTRDFETALARSTPTATVEKGFSRRCTWQKLKMRKEYRQKSRDFPASIARPCWLIEMACSPRDRVPVVASRQPTVVLDLHLS
jgi:hypothetical protein